MKFQDVIGIDVGKLKNESVHHLSQKSFEFDNNSSGFKKLIKWVEKQSEYPLNKILFAFEHTGIYSFPLSVYLSENKLSYIVIPGLEIKRSMGIARGKDDVIDAQKIALYTFRRKDEIKPYQLPSKRIIEIRRLLSLREKLVKHKSAYSATLNENKQFLKRKENRTLFEVQEKMITELNKQISKVENELEDIIKHDDQLKRLHKLITSIKGIGNQTALFMIAFTNGFTLFDNHRKFASYAGIAPFPYQSGISIKGKTKVSHLANKKMKSLLNTCAVTAITHNAEMQQYYERRIKEGKSKMSTINIIRNRLLSRVFAVVKRGTPYVNTMQFAS